MPFPGELADSPLLLSMPSEVFYLPHRLLAAQEGAACCPQIFQGSYQLHGDVRHQRRQLGHHVVVWGFRPRQSGDEGPQGRTRILAGGATECQWPPCAWSAPQSAVQSKLSSWTFWYLTRRCKMFNSDTDPLVRFIPAVHQLAVLLQAWEPSGAPPSL